MMRHDLAGAALCCALGFTACVEASDATRAAAPPGAAEPTTTMHDSPYGISAHLTGAEFDHAEDSLRLMAEAGVGWARSDFWRVMIQKRDGSFEFDRMDRVVSLAHRQGMQVLPILCYEVDWAEPAYQNLDPWLAYVRRTVERYRGQLRHWEVWNEPNYGRFWPESNNPATYVSLLKPTYELIKSIDPDATVLTAGLSQVPLHWVESFYQAGAAPYFDVMNVHPYRFPSEPEAGRLYEELVELRQLMTKHGDGDKPIWVTEVGWPRHRSAMLEPDGGLLAQIVRAGLAALDPQRRAWTIGVLDLPPDYPLHFRYAADTVARMAPGEAEVQYVPFEAVAQLDPQRTQALLFPMDEGFPAEVFDDVEAYVRRGGTLILAEGAPLYYTVARRSDGPGWERKAAGESFRRRLHVELQAHWTHPGVPHGVDRVTPAGGLPVEIELPPKAPPAMRFFAEGALKPGDRMIPLLVADAPNYHGAAAVAYDLGSDLSGGVIVSGFYGVPGGAAEQLAQILPRTYLLCFQAGVERVFWYEFESSERNPFDKESHFGIVDKGRAPSDAYRALQTLTRVRPTGSVVRDAAWRTGGVYHPSWRRPDGAIGWALWRPGGPQPTRIAWDGELLEAVDHLGRTIELSRDAPLDLGGGPIYLIGPEAVRVEPSP